MRKIGGRPPSLRPLNDEVGLHKHMHNLPEDLLVLQQEFSEQFRRLQEEVGSDLSRAHLNVELKLRHYAELLMARQRSMFERMMVKSGMSGTAEDTLLGARQDLVQHDRPHVADELVEKSQNDEAAAHDDGIKDRSAEFRDKVSTCLPGMYHEDDRVMKIQGVTGLQDKVSHSHKGDKMRSATFSDHVEEVAFARVNTPNGNEWVAGTGASAGGVEGEQCREKASMSSEESPPQLPVSKTETVLARHGSATGKSMKKGVTRASLFRRWDTELDLELHAEEATSKPVSTVQKIESSKWFDSICALVLVGNAVFIGIQADLVTSSRPPIGFVLIDVLFTLLFVAEVVIRMAAADSLRLYFTKEGDWSWNWFDFGVTSFAVVETFLSLVSQDSQSAVKTMRVVRVLRVLRMIKVIRIIRVMRFFRSLRILIAAILSTIKSSIWTAMLLIMIVYLFALVFAQAAVDHRILTEAEEQLSDAQIAEKELLWKYFGTLPRSIFTLWKSIVGGIDWEPAAEVLGTVSPFYVAVFVFYIALLYLAVLNVVAGLFLQTAVEQAQSDMSDIADEVRRNRQWYISLITDIFYTADKSNDGIVSVNEFSQAMSDPKMRDFLDLLGLQVSDALTLFQLLDCGENAGLDADDFVEGCLRLRGHARSLDIAQLMTEHKNMKDELFDIHSYLRLKLEGARPTAWSNVASKRAGVIQPVGAPQELEVF